MLKLPATHCMIDIETFGVKPNAAIISIGAELFRFGEIGVSKHFYCTVSLETCTAVGLQVEPETLQWWFDQNDTARRELFKSELSLQEALDCLKQFCTGAQFFWAKGLLDFSVLNWAYDAVGLAPAWTHRQCCDLRTLQTVLSMQSSTARVPHHALHDAMQQSEDLRQCLCKLARCLE